MKTFTYPVETWSETECRYHAANAPADAFGNKPPKGIIASSASTSPQYGQTQRYNGGTVINDEWYEAVARPLPIIPDTYEFYKLSSWGTVIRLKQ